MKLIHVVRRRAIVLPLAVAAAVTMVVISEASYWQSTRTLGTLDAMATASASVQDLQQSILDAEAAQRGFLLTGRDEHLQPYHDALGNIGIQFSLLDTHYGSQPEAAVVLGRLHTLTGAKLAQLAQGIRQRPPGPAATALGQVGPSDIDRAQMNAIRGLAAELLDHEAQRTIAGRDHLQQMLKLARLGIATLSALSLLALWLYLQQTAALKAQQLALKSRMQDERDELELEVTRRTAQLTELGRHLLNAREDERHRLAMNLHDELGALLTSAKLDAARIRSRLAGSAPEALERLAHLVKSLDLSIALGRSIVEDLRPSTLRNLGLVATLEILVREFGERSGVQVHCALAPVRLAPDAELTVYRVVQEAITNISKYAQARQVRVGMASDGGRVTVTVHDDGVGFDPAMQRRSAYGLVGMRLRVEADGGKLRIVSAPGLGTQLLVTLPALPAAPDDAGEDSLRDHGIDTGTGTTPGVEPPPAA